MLILSRQLTNSPTFLKLNSSSPMLPLLSSDKTILFYSI